MNYKFDIEKMTNEFNNANYAIGGYNCKIEDMDVYKTNEQMSEMVQRHAFKLGYGWQRYRYDVDFIEELYLTVEDKHIYRVTATDVFDRSTKKEIGLKFFSIEPETKMVKVLMTEKEFIRETSLQIIDRKDWNIVS